MYVCLLAESRHGNMQAGIKGCARPESQLSAGAVTVEWTTRQLAVALGRQAAKQAAVAEVGGGGALPPARAP